MSQKNRLELMKKVVLARIHDMFKCISIACKCTEGTPVMQVASTPSLWCVCMSVSVSVCACGSERTCDTVYAYCLAVVQWVESMAIFVGDGEAAAVFRDTYSQAASKMIDSLSFVDFMGVVYFSNEAKVLYLQLKCACCTSMFLFQWTGGGAYARLVRP